MFNKDTGLSLPSTSQVAERSLVKLRKKQSGMVHFRLQVKMEEHFTAEFVMRTLKRLAWHPVSGREVSGV